MCLVFLGVARGGVQITAEIGALLDDGRYVEATRSAREALAIAEGTARAHALEVAEFLDLLVAGLLRVGNPGDAEIEELAKRSLGIREAALGPDDVLVADSLRSLAELYQLRGKPVAARPLVERARAIQEAKLGTDDLGLTATLRILAFVTAERAAAEDLLNHALEVRSRALGDDHPLVAQSLLDLGWILQLRGDHARARECFERSAAIREKALRPDHPELGRSLAHLGWNAEARGDFRAALGYYERARAIREVSLPSNHRDIGRSLDSLGQIHQILGDYLAARTELEGAVSIFEKAYGSGHPETAGALTRLARLHAAIGDLVEARQLHERALAIHRARDSPEAAGNLADLGVLSRREGDLDSARTRVEEALAILRKHDLAKHPRTASAMAKLAVVEYRAGRHEEAARLLGEARAIQEAAGGADDPMLAELLRPLAWIRADQGDHLAAQGLIERSLAIRQKVFGERHPLIAESLVGSAWMALRAGDEDGALESSLDVERMGRGNLHAVVAGLAENEALEFVEARISGLDLALTVAARGLRGTRLENVWDAVIRSRALVLDEMAVRHRAARRAEDPQVAGLWRGYEAACSRVAGLIVRSLIPEGSERYVAALELARGEVERFERALSERSARFREERGPALLGFDEAARALPEDSALVSYVRFSMQRVLADGSASMPNRVDSVPSYIAFVLNGAETAPLVVPLGRAEEIDRLVREWYQKVALPPTTSTAMRLERETRAAGDRLREKIWDPVAGHLRAGDRVFIVPDLTLHLVSFGALPVGETGYLAESGPLLHYLSSERDLVRVAQGGTATGGLLAVGAPAYDVTGLFAALSPRRDGGVGQTAVRRTSGSTKVPAAAFRGARSECTGFRSHRFEPLVGTIEEVERVVRLWRTAHDGSAGRAQEPVARLVGEEASETALKSRAAGHRVLHLATHGFFLDGRCESTLDGSRGIGKLALEDERPVRPVKVENPLRLSGLALAGANNRDAAGPDEDDGILTAEEIAALDLTGVEWVVLSACETGLGELRSGEGVLGMRRAFRVAGARTVIMSLWGVDDDATLAWMGALYEARLSAGKDTADAVRSASLSVLRERRSNRLSTHPFYWAGFVAVGDWR